MSSDGPPVMILADRPRRITLQPSRGDRPVRRFDDFDPRTGAASGGRWFRVANAEVVPIPELKRRFLPVQRQKLETRCLLSDYLTCWQDWEIWEASDEYLGYWLLARPQADQARVVAAGEWLWIPGDYYHWVWGGHVVLPISEWRQICTRTV